MLQCYFFLKVLACLLSSLAHSPYKDRDVILYVISDYLAVISSYDEALKVAKKLKESPQEKYLIANIYAAKVKDVIKFDSHSHPLQAFNRVDIEDAPAGG